MSRWNEVKREEINRIPCECGKGHIVTYRITYENDEVMKDKDVPEKIIECNICKKQGNINLSKMS